VIRDSLFSPDFSSARRARTGVLVAEDNPMFRRILQSWLEEWGYQVTIAEAGEAAWRALNSAQPPQLAILDWMMPEIDGVELCRRIRARKSPAYQYILMLTARDNQRDRVLGFEAGADDYLTKPFDRDELRARLRVGKRILALQEDLIRAREGLRYQATHDVLTGTFNRGAILGELRRALDRAKRTGGAAGLLLLDLDHFKLVNDRHGHLAGDAVLLQAARRVLGALRTYDFLGRYGGEEFLAVLPDCDGGAAARAAERIRAAVADSPIAIPDDGAIAVSVSIGGVAAGEGCWTETALLAAADSALYEAKEQGRNRVVMAQALALP
jgi:diguanylate cyclase (GGDEF)-like protein